MASRAAVGSSRISTFGIQDERHGQQSPLDSRRRSAHGGNARRAPGANPIRSKRFLRLYPGIGLAPCGMLDQGLGHLVDDPVDRVQVGRLRSGRAWLPGTTGFCSSPLRLPHDLLPIQPDAALHLSIIRQKPHQGLSQGGLAGAGLPHEGGDAAGQQVQAHLVEGQEGMIARPGRSRSIRQSLTFTMLPSISDQILFPGLRPGR